MKIYEYISNSEMETRIIAEDLCKKAVPGIVFALYGDMGSGKTVIAKGLALGAGVKDEITSPTFLLLEEYSGFVPFYHFDLYRINEKSEFDELDFESYWNSEGISVVEWAEKAGERLPSGIVKIRIEMIDETKRRIIVEYPDN